MATHEHHNQRAEDFLKTLPTNSAPAGLSDFPYGLKFMGKKWDYDLPSVEWLTEYYRVLKPGAFLFGFSSSRTYHRLTCRLEDVGFEIRDCIMWIYGSGFPKGLNISKAFDKVQNYVLRDKWGGYNTVLKPAYEPIVVAMKPYEGTIIQNCEKYGVGGLNIDECRIELNGDHKGGLANRVKGIGELQNDSVYSKAKRSVHDDSVGRYPSNVLLSEWAGEELDKQSGILKSGAKKPTDNRNYGEDIPNTVLGKYKLIPCDYPASEGGASRFFYVAKACPSDRNYGMPAGKKNTHPTVKPIKLMRYLVRLLKQPSEDFFILDACEGSGGTGVACMLEGVSYKGNDMDAGHHETAKMRTAFAYNECSSELFNKAS
ncbi:MAG: site-specific DNA-methyltransferase [Sphingobacteriales bacterium]|nr:MAG: site-specific DNA-methyltransferase [Sphingobacteriales bacterium]